MGLGAENWKVELDMYFCPEVALGNGTQEMDQVKQSRQKRSEEGSFQKLSTWTLAVLAALEHQHTYILGF